jgi:hypothetical protein
MSATTTQTHQSVSFDVKDDAPVEIPRGTVEASLTFYAPPADGSAPFNYVEKPPQGQPQRNYTEDTHTVTIHDIRGHESEYDFNVNGFGVIQNVPQSAEKEFTSDDSIREILPRSREASSGKRPWRKTDLLLRPHRPPFAP